MQLTAANLIMKAGEEIGGGGGREKGSSVGGRRKERNGKVKEKEKVSVK